MPRNVLIGLYFSLVYPALIQNIIIWGDMSGENYRRVFTKVNKILRIVLDVKFNENNVPLLGTNII